MMRLIRLPAPEHHGSRHVSDAFSLPEERRASHKNHFICRDARVADIEHVLYKTIFSIAMPSDACLRSRLFISHCEMSTPPPPFSTRDLRHDLLRLFTMIVRRWCADVVTNHR